MMINKLVEGETLYAEGRLEEAENCFLSVIEEDSKNKVAFNNIGVIAYRMNDLEKAVDYFTKSLNEDPYFEDAIINLLDLIDVLDCSPLLASHFGDITEFDPQVN
jgi:tetratricopeptide (TPR) repeat protein